LPVLLLAVNFLHGSNRNRITEVTDLDNNFPAVELRGVSKRFGQRVILDRIDLTVARGEVLALVGASGSGKSTLLKLVSGIETPDAGRVFLAGSDCTDLPPYRRAVHTVFQNYALFPHLDVTGNIAFPLSIAGVPPGERQGLVTAALGWVQLERHARRRVDSLSGGERQRVALARALVDSPACVLLDEPLSALDPHLRAETLELLEDIQSRLRTTFIFITHDREEALRIGHRIGVLNRGRLEQLGTPEEIYSRPRTAFVASFMGKINWLRGQVAAIGADRALMICGQRIPCANQNGCAGDVVIGVRPEHLQIRGDGFLPAQVASRQFLGDSVVVRVTLTDGTTLVADQRTPLTDAAVGATVRIGWAADAAYLFPPRGSDDEAQ
jgi:ABC-type Fe3+/spermidine/putrescine transport system ATPase subunit